MIDERAAARFGGISGILYVVLFLPAYIVGSPGTLVSSSSPQGVFDYFDEGIGTFLFFNGVLSIFAAFFFVWFLAVLHGVLRSAEGDRGGEARWLSSAALAGGLMFVILSWAGVAVEISYPATLSRFANFEQDPQMVFWSLALSSWLYHFCQIGTAVLAAATSLLALATGVLPNWLAILGFVIALLALLHFVFPLLAALAGLLWVAVVSVLLLTGAGGRSRRVRTARAG
jgi:hypothetical protein